MQRGAELASALVQKSNKMVSHLTMRAPIKFTYYLLGTLMPFLCYLEVVKCLAVIG